MCVGGGGSPRTGVAGRTGPALQLPNPLTFCKTHIWLHTLEWHRGLGCACVCCVCDSVARASGQAYTVQRHVMVACMPTRTSGQHSVFDTSNVECVCVCVCVHVLLCRPQNPIANLLVGGTAGIIAASACYPLDTIRRRMQVR